MDLLALNFQVPDMVVYVAIGLGIVTAVGLVIREQVQGGETGIVSTSSTKRQQSHAETEAK
jgi:hypothetical protein